MEEIFKLMSVFGMLGFVFFGMCVNSIEYNENINVQKVIPILAFICAISALIGMIGLFCI